MAAPRVLLPLSLLAAVATAQPWERKQPARSPSPREAAGMVFDSARGRVVLFGGNDETQTFADTWAWDGVEWTQLSDAGPPRSDHGMAYDARRDRVVVFGGLERGAFRGDTWEWDGLQWRQVADGGTPQRVWHMMDWAPHLGVSLVFGGDLGGNFSDVHVWAWDGGAWAVVADGGAGGPPSRRLGALAADPVNRRMLLFAGLNVVPQLTYFADTWQLDDAGWRQLADGGPSPRGTFAIGLHPATGAAVVFGGVTSPTTFADDTWLWDGAKWRFLTDAGPSPRRLRSATVDPVRGVMVLFGGFNGAPLGDTWELRFAALAPDGGRADAGGFDGGGRDAGEDGGADAGFDGGTSQAAGASDAGPQIEVPMLRPYQVGCGCTAGLDGAMALVALAFVLRARRRPTRCRLRPRRRYG